MTFDSSKLSPELLEVLHELEFTTMTPIQVQSIPLLLEGKDVIAQSKTGSGKTAAYSLPILEKIDIEAKTLQALIVCPTRELCTQVAREIRKLGRRLPMLHVAMITGGQPMSEQVSALRQGAQIAVGTPGRLVDLIHRGKFEPADIRVLVLDEADRMLDMGFEDDMAVVMETVPRTRQTAFFSATYPPTIQAMSKNFQMNPVRVTVEESERTVSSIQHLFYDVEAEEKMTLLMRVLRRMDPEAAILFCNLKLTTTDLGTALAKEGFSADFLNGDLEQRERDETLAKFRNGSTRLLVATDVAARGLDIEDLPLVIHYEMPRETETYIHRAGRTGRAGRSGVSLSLLAASERPLQKELQIKAQIVLEPAEMPARSDTRSTPRQASMQTLFIAGGRKDKVRPGDLLGALTGDAGIAGTDVGKIEIHDLFSYVAVSRKIAESAAKKLALGRIKNRKFAVRLLR